MRIPRFKVYRAFSELDPLSDQACESLVRKAEINHTPLVFTVPRVAVVVMLLAWPGAWVAAALTLPIGTWLPLPTGVNERIGLLAVTTVFVAAVGFLIVRDIALMVALRRELHRAHCPKCDQPLVGLPIRAAGDDNDPAKRFVRCPECGKRHMLLDLGLTPLDLIPYEQRGIAENLGAKRVPPTPYL